MDDDDHFNGNLRIVPYFRPFATRRGNFIRGGIKPTRVLKEKVGLEIPDPCQSQQGQAGLSHCDPQKRRSTRREKACYAITMSEERKKEWSGHVVARILPKDIEDNYDQVRKPTVQRIDPLTLDHDARDCMPTAPGGNFLPSGHNGVPESSLPASELEYDSSLINIEVAVIHNESHGPLTIESSIRLTRNSDEEASKCLQRIGISLEKKLHGNGGKKGKKRKGQNAKMSTPALVRCLISSSSSSNDASIEQPQEMDITSMTVRQLFKSALISSLIIEVILADMTISLTVECNPPTVLGLRTFEDFRGQNFPGIPLVVEVDLLFATHAIVNWYVDGKLVHRDARGYTPTLEHAGKNISITVTPIRNGHSMRNGGGQEGYRFRETIANSIPDNMLLRLRPEWQVLPVTNAGNAQSPSSKQRASSELRVLTYNILADQNAFSKEDKSVPFFPYVPFEIMVRSRRMPLLVHEILAYHADLICLQEVDQLVYDTLLRPVLEYHEYQGCFSVKRASGTREGCALFWSLKRFRYADTQACQTHQIGQLLTSYSSLHAEEPSWNESVGAIARLLETRPDLLEIVRDKLGHVLQIAHLTDVQSENKLLIANTHLFFHPLGNHIRLLQCYAICHQLLLEQQHLANGQDGGGRHQTPFILCGDLNTSLESLGALMIQRHTPENYRRTKQDLNKFQWGPTIDENDNSAATTTTSSSSASQNAEDDFPAISLPPAFPTLRPAYSQTPAFTHYVDRFHAALDHILITSSPIEGEETTPDIANYQPFFRSIRCAAMPTEEQVTRHVAMPSIHFPSDHVSLVCDLEWKTNS
jgi:mRNA deadenylase 3'-5' endonuclease subunit Ccr4